MTLTVLMKRMVIEIVQGGQLEISSDSVSDISKVSSYVSKVSPPQYLYSFTNISGISNCKVPPPRPFVPALFLEIQGLNQLGLLKIPPIFKHFPKYSLSPHIAPKSFQSGSTSFPPDARCRPTSPLSRQCRRTSCLLIQVKPPAPHSWLFCK